MSSKCLSVVFGSKFGLCSTYRRRLLFVSLVFVLLFSLFSCVSVMGVAGSYWYGDNVVRVNDESELKNAVNNALSGVQIVISLDNNVTLTESLNIPTGKNIILDSSGFDGFTLIGVAGQSTIVVDGMLTLGRLYVTHESGDRGRGVIVSSFGVFIMVYGEIYGNSVSGDGGGVYVMDGGSFTMSGGHIYGNHAVIGGGVYNDGVFELSGGRIAGNTAKKGFGGGVYNRGTFNMLDGLVRSNKANIGGGVYTDGAFTMSGGTICANAVMKQGGGVYIGNGVFRVFGGRIYDNTATSGGGIWIDVENLDRLFVSDGVVFSTNFAFTKYNRDPARDVVYNSNIGSGVTWSKSFTQGYNNYDIGYKTDNWVVANSYTLLAVFSIILIVIIWATFFFLWYSKNGAKKVLTKIEQKTARIRVTNALMGGGGALLFGNTVQILMRSLPSQGLQIEWILYLIVTVIGAVLCIVGIIILWAYLRNKLYTELQSHTISSQPVM
jgi:TRAP-type C4-dicarboxylate transport system permease small subunit